jgi:hypothetical protein
MLEAMYQLTILLLIIFLINLPFGYWRANEHKFSKGWFLAIHLPIPLLILIRLILGITWQWPILLLSLTSFATGQAVGSLARQYLKTFHIAQTSCLIMDLFNQVRKAC